MLRERVITALLVAPLAVLAVFLLPPLGFGLVLAVVFAVGAQEWAGLSLPGHRWSAWLLPALLLAATVLILFAGVPTLVLMLVSLPFWMLGLAWLGRPEYVAPPLLKWLAGLPVLLGAWAGLHLLQGHPLGPWLLCTLVALVWGADIGAYFAGRFLGRHRLAPRISPGKTWEGVAGGLLLSLVVAVVAAALLAIDHFIVFVGLCLLTALVSVAGDLIESILKRQAGAKDSGVILPGHGGILDRVDSLLIATPTFVLGLAWLGVL